MGGGGGLEEKKGVSREERKRGDERGEEHTYTSGITVKYPFAANWSAMSWMLGKSMPITSVMMRMAFCVLPSLGYAKYVRTVLVCVPLVSL